MADDLHRRRENDRWRALVDAALSERGDAGPSVYERIYDGAGRKQWLAADYRPDQWSLQPGNPLGLPASVFPLHGTDTWRAMSERTQGEMLEAFQGWQISQILFGEHAALEVSAKLATLTTAPDIRLALSAQVFDEARHVQAYTALLGEAMRQPYRPSSSLSAIVGDILESSEPDLIVLGMQILIEGFALGLFRSIQAYSSNEGIRRLFAKVLEDEARHFSFGRNHLRDLVRDLDESERRIRREFVVEAVEDLNQHMLATDLWRSLSLGPAVDADALRRAPSLNAMRRMLFRQIVPTVHAIGLLEGPVRDCFERLDILHYRDFRSLDEV